MKILEKIRILENEHFSEWFDTRRAVDDEFSNQQSMFCVCGKLATGLHERRCSRFNNKVNSETVKRLKHLLENKLVESRNENV